VNVLHIDGSNITIDPRPITTGYSPYTMDINAAGTLAAVSNMGRGDGDMDTVSLIELTKAPYHVVGTVAVPSGPEPQKFSPDGKFLAVGSQEGTTKPHSPFHQEHGHITVFAVDGDALRKVAEAPIGKWAEGLAFSRDGKTIMVQSMYERTIDVFRWDGRHLTAGKPLVIKDAGPESFGTAWP
jgi:DNA-binding beta-propeller fold protein YncE